MKFPTRERAAVFGPLIRRYVASQATERVRYKVTLDADDPQLEQYLGIGAALATDGVRIDLDVGVSENKIHACNRDMEKSGEWWMLALASDDMVPVCIGWDAVLLAEMEAEYPDSDGVLFHNDGFLGRQLNTLCILGRKYYDRFGYIYHPAYESLWSDNEFMDVADGLGRQTYSAVCLFSHQHASRVGRSDALAKRNNRGFRMDEEVYRRRKREGFPP